jgi:hypothetical protein
MPAPASGSVEVRSECDASSAIVAVAPRDAALQIHHSIAGAAACYFVTATVHGETIQGYVLDRQADAVVAFETSRVEVEQIAFKAPLPLPLSPGVEPSKALAVKASPNTEAKKPLPKSRRMSM